MRIQTNVDALNAYRNLNNTNRALSKSLERLSSGFRINRAADDAAGLAISEKMRAQVRGLNQAIRNAQDGISLIQTAEGSLNETHAILQRMRELAVQAANDTLTASDRTEIQKEVDQLRTEIDRIANTTEFNTKKLLDGTTSALVSTDKLTTKVFMRDGLRVEYQFGQKASGGGNFRLDIIANPGVAQIQKTDIFKIKHAGAGVEADVERVVQGGNPNEVQRVSLQNVSGGTFTLTFDSTEVQRLDLGSSTGGTYELGDGTESVTLNWNASASDIQTALEGIYGENNVEVAADGGTFTISFYDLGQASNLQLDESNLTITSALTATDVSDIENIKSAAGVTHTGTGDVPTFVYNGTEGQIGIETYGGFAWGNVNTQDHDATITISKVNVSGEDKLKVQIEATDKDGNILSVDDTFAVVDGEGNYAYSSHGVNFHISGADFAAMDLGDNVAIDLELAVSSGIDEDLIGAVSTQHDWTTNETVGVKGVYEFTIGVGGIVGVETFEIDPGSGPITLTAGTDFSPNAAQATVAESLRQAIRANDDLAALYTVSGAGATIILTERTASGSDFVSTGTAVGGTGAGLGGATWTVTTESQEPTISTATFVDDKIEIDFDELIAGVASGAKSIKVEGSGLGAVVNAEGGVTVDGDAFIISNNKGAMYNDYVFELVASGDANTNVVITYDAVADEYTITAGDTADDTHIKAALEAEFDGTWTVTAAGAQQGGDFLGEKITLAGGISPTLTVTVYDGEDQTGNILSVDTYTYDTVQNNLSYNNHGISFGLTRGTANELELNKNIDYVIEDLATQPSLNVATVDAYVKDITNISAAQGVTNNVTGSVPTFYNLRNDTAGQINIDNRNSDFDWADVDTREDTTITITKTANALKVEIQATDGDGKSLTVTDEYAKRDSNGNYVYNAHGIQFYVTEADFAAMNVGDNIEIDLAVATATSANNTNIVDELGGVITTQNDWTDNATLGTRGVYAFTSPGNIGVGQTVIIDGITLTEGVDFNRDAGDAGITHGNLRNAIRDNATLNAKFVVTTTGV